MLQNSLLVEIPPYRTQRLAAPVHVNFYVSNGKRKRSQLQRFSYVPTNGELPRKTGIRSGRVNLLFSIIFPLLGQEAHSMMLPPPGFGSSSGLGFFEIGLNWFCG